MLPEIPFVDVFSGYNPLMKPVSLPKFEFLNSELIFVSRKFLNNPHIHVADYELGSHSLDSGLIL